MPHLLYIAFAVSNWNTGSSATAAAASILHIHHLFKMSADYINQFFVQEISHAVGSSKRVRGRENWERAAFQEIKSGPFCTTILSLKKTEILLRPLAETPCCTLWKKMNNDVQSSLYLYTYLLRSINFSRDFRVVINIYFLYWKPRWVEDRQGCHLVPNIGGSQKKSLTKILWRAWKASFFQYVMNIGGLEPPFLENSKLPSS